jgi:uncharacterized protein
MPREATLDRVRREVLDALGDRPVDVWLYGSWAKGTESRTSDIDVALDPHGPLSRADVARLRERLEEIPVAYPVEVTDLRDAGPAFRERVRREGILWNGSSSGMEPVPP